MIDPAVRQAFVDESFHEAAIDGFYVLAAVVFEAATHEAVRTAMHELRGKRGTGKLHWNEMDTQQRHAATKTVADLEGFHIVTIGAPVPGRRQERARSACLNRLVAELHGYEVTQLFMESRTQSLNKRDIDTVRGARYALPKGTLFHIDHIPGKQDALFWAADIVAGAVRAHREGIEDYRRLLDECLYEVEVMTDC
ncbi:DUF3800 domain-containing protein [Haloactinomyces albus]|uniref:DUF3800 domain-containing protein n=1 Tax=Haloactinomyces albus TaxID=1352928 RepID=A0AAE3ZBY3_9ACTN|nr:DUF3800 domain-containing protein [Haloactinomyces albus]MDR7302087.1 hypothetical protein [Haloactinomyces albus]